MGSHAEGLRGPDLAEGIPMTDLERRQHARWPCGRGPGASRPARPRPLRHRRHVHALRRPARRGARRRRHRPLPLASRLLQPAHRRGAAAPALRPGRLLGGRAARRAHRRHARSCAEAAARPPVVRRPPAASSSSAAAPRASPRPRRCAARATRASSRCSAPTPSRPVRPAEPLEGLPRRQGARGVDLPQATEFFAAPRHRARARRRASPPSTSQAAQRRARRRPQPRPTARCCSPPAPSRSASTIPGADRPHVFTCARSPTAARSSRRRGAARAVVIGASFIGLEVAASLRARGLEVHVVAPGRAPAGAASSAASSATSSARCTRSTASSSTSGASRRRSRTARCVLDDGTGSPPTSWSSASACGRDRTRRGGRASRVDRGVLVDALLETSAPGIFAAGDIARSPTRAPARAPRASSTGSSPSARARPPREHARRGEPFDARPVLLEPALRRVDPLCRARLRPGMPSGGGEHRRPGLSCVVLRGGETVAVASIGRDAERCGGRR